MTITPELKALYAGSTARRVLDTLQLSHPTWPGSFWFVNDVVGWIFQLETAVQQPFAPMPFELKLPNKDTGGNQELAISICNIGQEMMQYLEMAVANPEPISCTLRVYLDVQNSPPQNSPPLVLAISEVNADIAAITATASRYDVMNRGFPSRFYTTDEFPGLRR